ncbi:MAG: hypothetical protein Q9212_000680 [Teloschistes hypoglaucus]
MASTSGETLHDCEAIELQPSKLSSSSKPKVPRPDGGKDAWLFLAGGFSVEALVWGFPFSFGVFQEYYSSHEPFQSDGGIAIIGTLSAGLMYFMTPVVIAACKRFPHLRQLCTFLGLIIMSLALVASSFAQSVWQLIITQGLLYALGGCMLYMPTMQYLDEWFVERKGLALGFFFAGTGVGGVVIPLVMNWALHKWSASTALRIWALVLTAPLIYFIKPRLPVPADHKATRNQRLDFNFLKQPVFWFMEIGNFMQGIGYFIPTVFLPTFAHSLGLSQIAGSSTLSLLNAATVVGGILLGALSDKYDVINVMVFASIGSVISIFLIWGFSTSIAPLYVFSIIYGVFGGGFSSCWASMVKRVQSKDSRAEMGLVFGAFAAARGIGCIASGPLTSALLKGGKDWNAGAAYGTGYGLLIVFTGVTALLGCFPGIGKGLKLY